MKSRTLAALLLLALVLAVVVGFGVVQLSAEGTLTERWVSDTERDHEGNHHPVVPVETDEGTSFVAPINDVGDDATMTPTSCALVRLDGATGETQWTAGIEPRHCNVHAFSDPAVADVDGDGTPEVLVGTGNRALVVYDSTDGSKKWEHEFDSIGYGKPAVANLTPAAGTEVVAVDLKGNVFAIHANGTTAWRHELSETVWADPVVEDVDGDGTPEVLVGSGDGVTAFDADGTVRWRTDAPAYWMVAGQADGEGARELFVADPLGDEHSVQAIDGESGEVLWNWTTDREPAIHAVGDADGTSELYVSVDGGRLVALDASDGTVNWETEVTASEREIVPPPSLGDVDGDGAAELVAVTSGGLVTVIEPGSGDQLASYERAVPVWTHPTLVDADGDGTDEIVVLYGDGRVVSLSYSE